MYSFDLSVHVVQCVMRMIVFNELIDVRGVNTCETRFSSESEADLIF